MVGTVPRVLIDEERGPGMSLRTRSGRGALRAALGLVVAMLVVQVSPVRAIGTPVDSWTVGSPSGEITAEVSRGPAGALTLTVRRSGAEVLSSDLGLVTSHGDLTRGLTFLSQRQRPVSEDYRTAVGKRRHHQDTAVEMSLTFGHPSGARLRIDVRLFDDGFGYRYALPGSGAVDVLSEASSFHLDPEARVWAGEYRENYENLFEPHVVREVAGGDYMFPALFELPRNNWVLLSESDVTGRYAAAHLRTQGEPGRFRLALPPGGVSSQLPLSTPWRVGVIGDLAGVVESDLITDLAQDQRFPIPEWVSPGKVAWSWWSDGDSPRSVERQRDFVDHAAEEGWEHVLVDEGWSSEWMPELVRYARERGVGVLLWSRWTDLDTQAERDARLPRWKSWGVGGIKVDFMDSDSQDRMRWYDEILADTADHQLAINLHGATVPRGIERTWPHVMMVEAVRGAEDYHFGYLTPRGNTILPFTRNVVGSMDYTPTTFSAQRRETSAAHELALPVVYESGWQHPADSAETYDGRGVAEAVLRELPTVWDQTELVGGEPGESAVVARRSGERWFVGAITAGGPQQAPIPLDFLAADSTYTADIIRDEGRDGLAVERRRVRSGDELTVPTAVNGGAVVLICPGTRASCLDVGLLSRVDLRADEFLTPGKDHRLRISVENESARPLEQVRHSVVAPRGWRVEPAGPTLPGTIPPGGKVSASWIVSVPQGVRPGSSHSIEVRVEHGSRTVARTAVHDLRIRPHEPVEGSPYLSDLVPLESFNWVGPVERDMNNGGSEEGDGGALVLDGRTYAKGLGGHAHSEQLYYLGRNCARFGAKVGVDDVVGDKGSVTFQVWGDDRLLHDSGPLTGTSPAAPVDVDVTGVEGLRLVLADGGDYVAEDLGDWADARLRCSGR